MKHLYFVRHGQTVWNVEDKICGMTDSPLTQKGREQAKEAAELLLKGNYRIDEILYSPLSRARDTALIISEVTGIPAREEKRLKEQNFGKWEGTSPRAGIPFREDKKNFVYDFDGGESMVRFCHRIYDLLDEIRDEESDKIYLLVAHNGVARAVQSYFYNMTNDEFSRFGIQNCEIIKLEYNNLTESFL